MKVEPLPEGEEFLKMFATETLKNNSTVLNEKTQLGSNEP